MPNQIEQRKEENPDNVHKMPIQTGNLYWVVISISESAAPRQHRQHHQDPNAHRDVDRVQPGHGKINPVKQLGISRIGAYPFKTQTRNEMIDVILVVLDRFERHKHATEYCRPKQ